MDYSAYNNVHGVLVLPTHESREMTMDEFHRCFPNSMAAAVHKFDDWYLTLLIVTPPDDNETPINRVGTSLYWFGRGKREEGKYVRGPVFVCDDYRSVHDKDFPTIMRSLKSTMGEMCRVCGKEYAQLKRCASCKSLYYCSVPCQTKDWKRHKPHCNKRPETDFIVDTGEEKK